MVAPRKREATLESAVWRANLRLSLRAGFLEKREKWRTPSYFLLLIKQARVILPRLRGPPATPSCYSAKVNYRCISRGVDVGHPPIGTVICGCKLMNERLRK